MVAEMRGVFLLLKFINTAYKTHIKVGKYEGVFIKIASLPASVTADGV